MKAAQLLAAVPGALPTQYAEQLATLQSHAPHMGPGFVARRMRAELGPQWRSKFSQFNSTPAAAASLGQVHWAKTLQNLPVACKLQYPNMTSAVEADVKQLQLALAAYKRFNQTINFHEAFLEIQDRLREELDYSREAASMRLFSHILQSQPLIRVPKPLPELSTSRLLVMDRLPGQPLHSSVDLPQQQRNRRALLLFHAWWLPLARYGVLHGDPHPGNYLFHHHNRRNYLHVLDFGCIRIFPPDVVHGVVLLRDALLRNDLNAAQRAYELWGFHKPPKDLVATLNIWARFIYAPFLRDEPMSFGGGAGEAVKYGREQAVSVRKALQKHAPLTIPRAFVYMDRAAIGLGAALIRLGARLNLHQPFNALVDDFDVSALRTRQHDALAVTDMPDNPAAVTNS